MVNKKKALVYIPGLKGIGWTLVTFYMDVADKDRFLDYALSKYFPA